MPARERAGHPDDLPAGHAVGLDRPPAYEAVVLDHMAKYVDRFSPGVLVEAKSPHYMEAAVSERIVQELEKVIAKA